MPKYNEGDFAHFGMNAKRIPDSELFEQMMDEEDLDGRVQKNNEDDLQNQQEPTNKGPWIPRANRSSSADEKSQAANVGYLGTLLPSDVCKGDLVQTITDTWQNADFIPAGTSCTVLAPPAKAGKGNAATVQYIVKATVLLESGQQISVRLPLANLKKADSKAIDELQNELKW